MNPTSKKATLLILAGVSVVLSRLAFMLVNDPEGPNLLIVMVLAAVIYAVFLASLSFRPFKENLGRLLPAVILLAYAAVLIKVMVFKGVPLIRAGQIMLNFGGTNAGHAPNLIPLSTIIPYLLGSKGLLIGGINIIGNIVLLVPFGFLLPLVFRAMSWKTASVIAIASGLLIELMQAMLRVGIFDIDDVILNAIGTMIGYSALVVLASWLRSKKYAHIVLAAFSIIAISAVGLYALYPKDQPVLPRVVEGADPCGGTGGNGEIVGTEGRALNLRLHTGAALAVMLTDDAAIRTSSGSVTVSDLRTGDRITLVGDAHRDGTFTAYAIMVCGLI